MAAQPIVRESYRNPVETYETNVMGTVNVLECIRQTDSVNSFLNVTTDKVYKNREWEWGYRENEELNGYDPYSNSKSCSELVTDSYRNSFFGNSGLRVLPITTARAGNVIGGGDLSRRDRYHSRLRTCSQQWRKDKGAQSVFRPSVPACAGAGSGISDDLETTVGTAGTCRML